MRSLIAIRSLPLLAAATALVVVTPISTAGFRAETAVATVMIEDRFGTDCHLAFGTSACVNALHADGDPGDWWIDGYQSLRYIALASNVSTLRGLSEQLADRDILPPDVRTEVSLQDAYFEHSVLSTAAPILSSIGGGSAASAIARFQSNDTELLHLYFFGPNVTNAQGPFVMHDWTFLYGTGIEQERLGPFHRIYYDETDKAFPVLQTALCAAAADLCNTTISQSTSLIQQITPNATIGVDTYEIEVATSPSLLDGPDDVGLQSIAVAAAPLVGEALREPLQGATRHSPPEEDPPGGTRAFVPPKASAPVTPAEFAVQTRTVPPAPLPSDQEGAKPLQLAVAATIGAAVLTAILALYRRIRSGDLSQNDARSKILQIANERPGIRLADVAKALGISHKGTDYHVHRLSTAGWLTIRRDFRQKRIYPVGAHSARIDGRVLAALQHPVARAILSALVDSDGPLTARNILGNAATPRSTLDWHLKTLVARGILRKDGWFYSIIPSPDILPIMGLRARSAGGTPTHENDRAPAITEGSFSRPSAELP